MIARGHSGVTYRVLAAEGGITAAAVQYYFPTLDDLFHAMVRRRVDAHLTAMRAALRDRREEPLRVLWEFATDEAMAALLVEFISLGNHRESVRDQISQITEEIRQVQLQAVRSATRSYENGPFSSLETLVFLLTNVPKMLRLERTVGVTTTHQEVRDAFEEYLDAVEPRTSG
jgi:AcrR family transcriptional regulator